MEAGAARDGRAGGSCCPERTGLDRPGHRGHHHGGQAGAGGYRSGRPGQCRLLHAGAFLLRPAARPRHSGLSGLRTQGSRRMSSLAGAGRLSGLHPHRPADAASLSGQPRLCSLRHHAGGGSSRRFLPAHSHLGNSAAGLLWGHAPLSASRRPGAGGYRHHRGRQPAQLVRQLGSHLWQTRLSGSGRQRLGPFHRDLAHLYRPGAACLRLEL